MKSQTQLFLILKILISLNYNFEFDSMKDSFKKKGVINLFDYALIKQQPIPKQDRLAKSISNSRKESEQSYGLETLLHFNGSLSSIRSQPEMNFLSINTQSKVNKTSKYEGFILKAKQDAQALKNKRINHEIEWRTKNKIQKYDDKSNVLDQSLAQSQVSSYNLSNSVYPIKDQRDLATYEDIFASQLKKQINKGKAETFTKKIKGVYILKFFSELKMFEKIKYFRQICNDKLLKTVFAQWVSAIKQVQSRRIIRQAILTKIRQRKEKQFNDQDVKRYYISDI